MHRRTFTRGGLSGLSAQAPTEGALSGGGSIFDEVGEDDTSMANHSSPKAQTGAGIISFQEESTIYDDSDDDDDDEAMRGTVTMAANDQPKSKRLLALEASNTVVSADPDVL